MQERRKAERRQEDRRKDVQSARWYLGMERRLYERRRGDRRDAWSTASVVSGYSTAKV